MLVLTSIQDIPATAAAATTPPPTTTNLQDGVRCGEAVAHEHRVCDCGVEPLPGLRPGRHLLLAHDGDVGGEPLVEPDLLPPVARDHVAEPRVGVLVRKGVQEIGALELTKL